MSKIDDQDALDAANIVRGFVVQNEKSLNQGMKSRYRALATRLEESTRGRQS